MSSQIDKVKQQINNSLVDQSKPWTQVFDFIEAKSGVPRLYAFLGIVAFVALYLIFGYGAQILCDIIGIAYPAYASIHAIETSPKEDDTKWLVYWVTFAVLTLTENFSCFLVRIIPFYYLLKCLFLIWCMVPFEANGANVIYHRLIRPYFIKHHKSADKIIDSVSQGIKKSAESILKND